MRKTLLSVVALASIPTAALADGKLTGTSVNLTEAIANASSSSLAPAAAFDSSSIGWGANRMTLSSDSLSYSGQNYVSTLHLDHNFGGTGMTGSRAGLDVSMVMRGTSSNSGNTAQYYLGIADYLQCGYNDNGSAGMANAAGSCVAINPIADLGSGSFWYTLNAEEVDVVSAPGSSSAHTFGVLSVKSGGGPRGSYDDAAMAFAAGSGAPTWATLIQVGKADGAAPTASDTKLIACARNAATAAPCALGAGVDLRDFVISGAAFASPGFSVDGSGKVAAASLTTSSIVGPGGKIGSIVLDTQNGGYTTVPTVVVAPPPSGIQATASVSAYGMSNWTMVAGGTGYHVDDVLSLGGGATGGAPGKIIVTAVDGTGSITGTAGLDGGSFPIPPSASAALAAAGGSGSGAQFSMTGMVKAITVTNGGSGYVTSPAISVTGSTGYGTAAHAVIGGETGGVLIGAFVRAADPTVADIPSGQCGDWNNTATGSYKHVCNFGGALRSVPLN